MKSGLLEKGSDDMPMEEFDWFRAYDAITIEDTNIIRTLIVPKKKKEGGDVP